jgi:multidrug efflux pump subunit AcrA (membrane-fusion protein)
MESATQNVQAANTQVTLAQARLDELANPDGNNVASAQASLSSSSAQYDAALARHEALLLGASEAEIAAAQAELASAQASLESLLNGPSDTEIKIYDIRLAQAETALQEAQNALTNATLTAPFGGTVTAVYTSEGEHASGMAARIMDTENLEVVLNVDEIDAGRLALGQPATVVMETWPGTELASEIIAIAPSASVSGNGIVSYEVHLNLPETELPILVGMTANADLVTSNLEEVVLVPNAAITPDRENGTFSVNLVLTEADGTTIVQPVEVTVGLRDSRYSEITSGLVEGDVVALGELVIPTIRFGSGGGPFGGD